MTESVIVVGAGPTGLMTACELARRGVAVTVLDAADGPFRGSRGKGLQPRSLEHLDRLGLADRLVSRGRFGLPIRRWAAGADGEPVATDHDPHPGVVPTPDSPYARTLIVPQWRTEQVLREHLSELGVEVRWGVPVHDVTQDDDRVRLDTGAGPCEAAWVVGCDGGSSAVRRAIGVPFLGETHEEIRMVVGDVVVDGVDRDHWHMWERFVGLCPLPATDAFVLQAGGVDPPGPLTRETFQTILDDAGAGHARVREVGWSSRWRLNVRMVDRYRVGRVLLAGDAAHVHSPAGGQGMNTGIGDAANLGWKLAAVLAGAGDALLDTYSAERLPVAADVLGLSTLLTTRRFEDRGAEGTAALQLGVTYRGGPLAADPGTGPGPRAGDRAPDAPLRDADGRRVRLFDVFRHPGWTLLGFDVVPQAIDGVRAVAVLSGSAAAGSPSGVGAGLTDRAGHAGRTYRPVAGELVLVRPDGHVALRTTDPAAVGSWPVGLGAVPTAAGV